MLIELTKWQRMHSEMIHCHKIWNFSLYLTHTYTHYAIDLKWIQIQSGSLQIICFIFFCLKLQISHSHAIFIGLW